MNRTVILLVRHAEVHNPEDIVYGRLPRFGLSELGRAQASATAEALAREPITAIYTSPRLRARQTAAAISRFHPGAPVHVSRYLDEVRTDWQGASWEEIGRGFNMYASPRADGDETIEQVAERMRRFVSRTLRRHPGETVAGVSHGDPIVIAKRALEGRELTYAAIREPDYPRLASVTRFVFEDSRLVSLTSETPAESVPAATE